MKLHVKTIAMTIAAALLTLPVGAQDRQALPSGQSKEELFGSVLRNSRWKTSSISVCWLDMAPENAPHRALVRRAVAETWEHHGPIKFTGWGACGSAPVGIRIRVADETAAPHVEWIGRFINNRNPGMTLNFGFTKWRTECQQTVDSCIYAIAVHEFGHALGFTHEQNRSDAPDTCKELEQGAVGDYQVTRYDPNSIMNYCNANWRGNGQLSALDIEALRTFYKAA
ncbi:M12 family metallopeptidase [Sandaracinobacter sp. RS1-74]|uniref:M12 family metallopeptidase n=1 Tax=Sandaracinobacteroides sayramensis TaxID=2913411 RepID=UPI001EDA1819|nr:M12 family metallopeptidase [Sandaracinobacteroides sayramensis]MCG2841208.1 M12 family metallopeptidase [Sandaracinobacteroides sayramensis]